jgi:hypothetical protein
VVQGLGILRALTAGIENYPERISVEEIVEEGLPELKISGHFSAALHNHRVTQRKLKVDCLYRLDERRDISLSLEDI